MMSGKTDEPETDDGKITCWCGEVGTFDELFDSAVYERTCGGSGVLDCDCGGDFCVCHNHGEVECDGCEDCLDDEDSDAYGWDDSYGEPEDY